MLCVLQAVLEEARVRLTQLARDPTNYRTLMEGLISQVYQLPKMLLYIMLSSEFSVYDCIVNGRPPFFRYENNYRHSLCRSK